MANEAYDAVMPAEADADKAKANKANKAADEADAKVDEADKVIAVDEAILDDAANKAIIADEANEASLAEAKELLANSIAIFLYSLTKYSAIVAKMKGYFGRTISNNQRKRWCSCSLRMQDQVKFNNQLERERRLVIEG